MLFQIIISIILFIITKSTMWRKYIIILYGINDITKLNKNENDLIEVFQKVIKKAHEANILIYEGTLTPFKGYGLYF